MTLQLTMKRTAAPDGNEGIVTPPGSSRLAGVAGQAATGEPPLALHDATVQAERPALTTSVTVALSAAEGPRLENVTV